MTNSFLVALTIIGALTAPAFAAEVSDLPECLKPNRTMSSVSVPTGDRVLLAQSSGRLDPACTYRVEQPPREVEIRGLW
jgi:hypothetical protein